MDDSTLIDEVAPPGLCENCIAKFAAGGEAQMQWNLDDARRLVAFHCNYNHAAAVRIEHLDTGQLEDWQAFAQFESEDLLRMFVVQCAGSRATVVLAADRLTGRPQTTYLA